MRRFKLFGHPLHPPTTHIPLGVLLIVPLWDVVALWRGGMEWWAISFWTLAAGLAFSLFTAITGLMDYLAVGDGHPGEKDIIRHLGVMAAALSLELGGLLVRGGPNPPVGTRMFVAVGLSLLGSAALGLGGWYGGQLVYHHKIGSDEE